VTGEVRSEPKRHHHFFFEFKSSPEVNRIGQNIIAEGEGHRNASMGSPYVCDFGHIYFVCPNPRQNYAMNNFIELDCLPNNTYFNHVM
jgi:hypothetical protein